MRGALEGPGRVPISAEEAGGRARELLRGEEELGVHERLRGAGAVREGVDVVPELRGRGPRRAGVRPVRQLRRPEVPRGEDHARVPLPAAAQGAGAAHVPPHVRVPRRAEDRREPPLPLPRLPGAPPLHRPDDLRPERQPRRAEGHREGLRRRLRAQGAAAQRGQRHPPVRAPPADLPLRDGRGHPPQHRPLLQRQVRVPRRAEVPRDRQGRQGLRARGRPTRAQARGGRHQGHRGARPRPVRQLRAAAHHPGEQRVQQEDHGVHQGELLRVLHPQVRQQRGGDRHQGGRR